MKTLTKRIIFFFGLITLIFFAFNISAGKTYACDRFTTCPGYPLSQMCAFFTATVNVTNPPSGKNIYVGCNGDNGNGYVKDMQMVNGVCTGQYCDGHYGGTTGTNWCQGDIQQVTNGGTVNLNHCSCQGKVDGACLQVLLSPNTPTMTNACTANSNPTIDTSGILPQDSGCTVSPLVCSNNDTTTTTTVNITCPLPTASVTVKVYVDSNHNGVLDTSSDPLYTGSFSGTNNGSTTFTGTGGTATIPNVPLGNATATLNAITGYTIVTTSPLANPVNYQVFATGTTVNFLIQAPLPPGPPAPTCNLNTTNTTFTISWSAVAGATSYNVYSGTTKLTSVTTTSYTTTDVSKTSFTVTAVNSAGESSKSAPASNVTCQGPPPGPTSGQCVLNSAKTGYNLTWDAITGATAYNIYAAPPTTPIATVTTNSYSTTVVSHGNQAARTYEIETVTNGIASQAKLELVCPCVAATTSCPSAQSCGTISDECGGIITCAHDCDTANTGQTCNENTCSCPANETPTHLACANDNTCQRVNICGVDSCTAGQNCGPATTLSFVIGLDGIGTTGDQKNSAYLPVAGQPLSGSTLSPVHTTRPVTVILTDSNQQNQQFQGNIVYDSTTTSPTYGKFVTITPIDLGAHIQPGIYTVYVTVGAHLTKSLGTVTIVVGQNNPVANGHNAGNLVAGDITGTSSTTADNQLTIEDYNVLISCMSTYSTDHTLCNSNSNFPLLSDLDDNGTTSTPLINEFDYNLWLREYSKTPNGDNPPGTTQAAQAVSPTLTVVSVVNETPSPSVAPSKASSPSAEPSVTAEPTITTIPTVTVEPSVTVVPTVTVTVEPSPSVAPTGTGQ